MGVKLMTGATGEQNIQAADDRECLAGITGLDSYVFPTGNRLKATLVDANTVTIGTGAGSLQGSRFRCSTTTTVNIQSGTQGQFRHDIVGLHFSRETSGREGLEFQVLTGEPAASDGAAADPAYTVGDLLKGDAEAFMPLYRVKLSGINAADPEPMFSVLTPLATLGDSVSRSQTRLGDRLMCYVDGGVCVIAADFLTVSQKNAIVRLGSLPDGLRPLGHIGAEQTSGEDIAYIGPLSFRGNNSIYGQIMVHNSGAISAYVNSTGSYFFGQLVFPVTRS
ncbi:MAG: hypothetical protein MSA17_03930 [Collinsella sp.]|nr:hypothetical protein [Collinsella sp.]